MAPRDRQQYNAQRTAHAGEQPAGYAIFEEGTNTTPSGAVRAGESPTVGAVGDSGSDPDGPRVGAVDDHRDVGGVGSQLLGHR